MPSTAHTDYADSRHATLWLRHPVLGDPSFDAFERLPGNPIHRGAPPYEWPVNAFLFIDPPSGHWYVYVGEYAKGYLGPPYSRCLLYRSRDGGARWQHMGVVLEGDAELFDEAGHTPDVSIVFDGGRYHMVYDWGTADFTKQGGIGYAWAERPEGPFHRNPQPITRNTTLPPLLGRYRRSYAATLLRRRRDWLILAMSDRPPHGWVMIGMTAEQPQGPYSERVLLLYPEQPRYHPPLLEFYPAFVHEGCACAPATSVALNRNFNVLFRAPLEQAHEARAWEIARHGSLWHSEPVPHEHFGLWGQTFSGHVVDGKLLAVFPSRDRDGMGTINLAQRPWDQPLRDSGFVLSAHAGPALTLLRRAYGDFELEAEFTLHGQTTLLLDHTAPLGPDRPQSDATLHPLSLRRYTGIRFSAGAWQVIDVDAHGQESVLGGGPRVEETSISAGVIRRGNELELHVDSALLWHRTIESPASGSIGWLLDRHSHLRVSRFHLSGEARPANLTYLCTEALLGHAESNTDWQIIEDSRFRHGLGAISRSAAATGKWNVWGSRLRLWSPRGPDFGIVQLRLDDRRPIALDLRGGDAPSRPLWTSPPLPDGPHALTLHSPTAPLLLDCLETDPAEPGA